MFLRSYSKLMLSVVVVVVFSSLWVYVKIREDDQAGRLQPKRENFQLRNMGDASESGQSFRSQDRVERKMQTKEDFLARWVSSASSLKGQELRAVRLAIINDAANRLSGRDLAQFLGEIIDSGEFSNYEIAIIAASQLLFSSAIEEDLVLDMAEWIGGVEDVLARQKLSYNLGVSYKGGDLGGVLGFMKDIQSKQLFLTAYCGALARTSPLDALYKYQTELPEGGSYSGLTAIASNLTHSFEEFYSLIPADNRSIAVEVRQAVIKSWGAHDPESAANFIRDNPEKVAAGDLAVAMKTWLKSEPNEALNWSLALEQGENRQTAVRAIVDTWKNNQPSKAWDFAIRENLGVHKKNVLMDIHAQWIKFDAEAAEKARFEFERLGQN